MTVPVKVRLRARNDLISIARHISNDSPDAAQRVIEAAFYTFDWLVAWPLIGRPEPTTRKALTGLRMRLVQGFPNYRVFYIPRRYGIEVVRVLHVARDTAGRF